MIQFTIPGPPLIQQRARLGKWGNFYDPSSKERKALSAKMLLERQRIGLFAPYKGDLSLRVKFFYHPAGKRKMDSSNMLKALEDSGNGVFWVDDDLICHHDIWKLKCEVGQERTEVQIEVIYMEPLL